MLPSPHPKPSFVRVGAEHKYASSGSAVPVIEPHTDIPADAPVKKEKYADLPVERESKSPTGDRRGLGVDIRGEMRAYLVETLTQVLSRSRDHQTLTVVDEIYKAVQGSYFYPQMHYPPPPPTHYYPPDPYHSPAYYTPMPAVPPMGLARHPPPPSPVHHPHYIPSSPVHHAPPPQAHYTPPPPPPAHYTPPPASSDVSPAGPDITVPAI